MSLKDALSPFRPYDSVLFAWDILPGKVRLYEVWALRQFIVAHLPEIPATVDCSRAHPLITAKISVALSSQ